MPTGTKLTDEQKAIVLEDARRTSPEEAAKKHNVAVSSIKNWRKKLKRKPQIHVANSRVTKVDSEVVRLRKENELLKEKLLKHVPKEKLLEYILKE